MKRRLNISLYSLLIMTIACGPKASDKQLPQVTAKSKPATTSPAIVDRSIPKLYKGMADSPENALGGLKEGSIAPNIVAVDSDGKAFNLHDKVKEGPVALVFYRGFWCPLCTKHLSALNEELAELEKSGLSIYAITPETDNYIEKTKEKSQIDIPFIYDKAHKIMDDYRVGFKVTEEYVEAVAGFAEVDLAETQGSREAFLPVPATYIINQEGKIIFAHYDHVYKNRATAEEMLSAVAVSQKD